MNPMYCPQCGSAVHSGEWHSCEPVDLASLRARIGDLEVERDALRDLACKVIGYTGCGDSSCRFVKPAGMATQGHCRCLGDRVRPGLGGALAALVRAALKEQS